MSKSKKAIKVAFADDHIAVRDLLANLIRNTAGYKVVFKASDGDEVLENISKGNIPDVLVLDLDMPRMNGYKTTAWLKENYPDVRILIFSMYGSDLMLIKLLIIGIHGFLKKDVSPKEILLAIKEVHKCGYYHNNLNGQLINLFLNKPNSPILKQSSLSDIQLQFVKLACSELTYRQIGFEMKMDLRQLEKLRETVFDKMGVKTRVGLVMFAIKNGMLIS